MYTYKVAFHCSSIEFVKTGKSTPFETYQTSSYGHARKDCLEFTCEDSACSAVLLNQETGNRMYFQNGQEK